jgi:hypothetical protein
MKLPSRKANFIHKSPIFFKKITLEKSINKRTKRRALRENHNQEKNDQYENHRYQPPHLVLPKERKQVSDYGKPGFGAVQK